MNDKIKKVIERNKVAFILVTILWVALAITFIMPVTCGSYAATRSGGFDMDAFFNYFSRAVANIGDGFQSMVKHNLLFTYLKNLLGLTLLYILVIVVGIIRTMPKHRYDDIEHGSSDWSSHGEQYQILNRKEGILLAENNYLPVDKRGNVNVLVVGGSGSGKSASYVIPNAYQLLGSYVFTDPKGELYDKTAGYLREQGYDIKILNLVNPKNSDGYNPLMHIESEIDVDVIANTIVKGQKVEGGSSDPYWDDMAEMLLKALIYYLLATRPEEEQNLASCAELVRAANSNGAGNLLTELMNQLPYDHPARMNYKSIEIAPEKTYGSILSTLQSKLGKFDSKEIAELTSTKTINFEDVGKRKTAVYVISSDTHAAYDFLLTIFFSQMIQRLYDFADKSGGALPQPTYFILDEFANIGKIPDFDKKISTSRSRKISFSVILQNLDQLEAVYEKSHETIIGNCDTTIFLGSNSQKTVEYFSKELGEKTIAHESWSVSKDKNMWRQGYNKSDQIMARALMTPDELRRLDNDLCIILEKGIKPIKAPKYYYFKYNTEKLVQKYACSHNSVPAIDRGKWRKYNPYNPYVEEKAEEKEVDTKIESLDDLFEETPANKPKEPTPAPVKTPSETLDNLFEGVEEPKQETPTEAPKQEDKSNDTYDLQKELEAKFDELFGAFDDNE